MIKVCKNCKEEFETTHSKRVCCSRKCSNELRFPKTDRACISCGVIMKVSTKDRRKYCSVKCKGEYQKTSLLGENNPNFKDKLFPVKCSFCGGIFEIREYNKYNSDGSEKRHIYCSVDCKAERQKESLLGKGNPNFNSAEVHCKICGTSFYKKAYRLLHNENDFCSRTCYAEHLKTMVGEKNHNYKHGLSEEYRKERRFNKEYIDWKVAVYEKYNYKCVLCGSSKDVQAHHLNSFDWCEEGRTDIENGVTLCKTHHVKFHRKYGYGKNTKEQFDEYEKLYQRRGKLMN